VSGEPIRWLFKDWVCAEPPRAKGTLGPDDPGFTVKGKVLGYALASYMNPDGWCFLTFATLARSTGFKETALRAGRVELAYAGTLDFTEGGGRKPGGNGKACEYQANTPRHARGISGEPFASRADTPRVAGENPSPREAQYVSQDVTPNTSTHSRRAAQAAANGDTLEALRDLVEDLNDADENTLYTFVRSFGQLSANQIHYAAERLRTRRRNGLRGSDARYAYAILDQLRPEEGL
jgi:hypothetical protein